MHKKLEEISKDAFERSHVIITDYDAWHSFDTVAPSSGAFHMECVSGFAIHLCDLFAFRSERQNNVFSSFWKLD